MTQPDVRRLYLLFALAYVCQGLCAPGALLNQPLRMFLNRDLNYDATQMSAFWYVVGLPWFFKPLYGLVSDLFPILGYRRKSYLLLLNLAAAGGFLWMTGVRDPRLLMFAAGLIGVGVAAADVVIDALMVEAGRETGLTRKFQGVQWISVCTAGIGASLLGAWIVGNHTPSRGLAIAATICIGVPLLLAALSLWAIRERRTRLSLDTLRETGAGLWSAARSLPFWSVLGLLLLLAFHPAGGSASYEHFVDTMKFTERFMGYTDAIASAGYVIGAVLFILLLGDKRSLRKTLLLGTLAAIAGTAPYLFVRGEWTLAIASATYGIGYMMGNLAMLSLAAAACPRRAEGFVFATVMACLNFSMQTSDYVGATLYDGPLNRNFGVLVCISIGTTIAALPLIWLLPIPARRDEEGALHQRGFEPILLPPVLAAPGVAPAAVVAEGSMPVSR